MAIAYHDLTHNPWGLWQFEEDLNDATGFGNHLVLASGSARYTDIVPGLRGLMLEPTTRLTTPSQFNLFAITGDLTIEMLVAPHRLVTAAELWVCFENNGETSADNRLWGVGVDLNGRVKVTWEYGAGSDLTFASDHRIAPGEVQHLAITRRDNIVAVYLNGSPLGVQSDTLTAPTDGSSANSRIHIGATSAGGEAAAVGIASFKVIDSALTPEQVAAEFNQTLGTVYGRSYGSFQQNLSLDCENAGGPFSGASIRLVKLNPSSMPTTKLSGVVWVRHHSVGSTDNHYRGFVQYTTSGGSNPSWKFDNGLGVNDPHAGRISFRTYSGATSSEKRVLAYATIGGFSLYDVWSMHGFTYDGTQAEADRARVYIDGINRTYSLQYLAYPSLQVPDGTPQLVILDPAGEVQRMNYHYCALFNDALTASDMLALYNGGFPMDPTVYPSCFFWMRGCNGQTFPETFDGNVDTIIHNDHVGTNHLTATVGQPDYYTEVDHIPDAP